MFIFILYILYYELYIDNQNLIKPKNAEKGLTKTMHRY